MKAETLAEWRSRIADRTLITLSVLSIERVLDERLRLLEALHAAREHLGDGDAMDKAIAALMYADEPVA